MGLAQEKLTIDQGVQFQVVPTLADDNNDPARYQLASQYVSDTAKPKAEEVWERCQVWKRICQVLQVFNLGAQNDPALPNADIVIAADTVINATPGHCEILNKPRNADQAEHMLNMLNNKEHQVLTAVHVIFRKNNGQVDERHFVESTLVKFSDIDPGLMKACKSENPF